MNSTCRVSTDYILVPQYQYHLRILVPITNTNTNTKYSTIASKQNEANLRNLREMNFGNVHERANPRCLSNLNNAPFKRNFRGFLLVSLSVSLIGYSGFHAPHVVILRTCIEREIIVCVCFR